MARPFVRSPLAVTAVVAFAVSVGLGFLADPAQARHYWFELLGAADRVGPIGTAHNQSLRGALSRTLGYDVEMTWPWVVAVVVSAVLAGFALRAAVRAGDVLISVLVVQVLGLLVSPISWDHHWVWIAPLLVDELERATQIRIDVPLPADKRLRQLCETLLRNPAGRATLAERAQTIGASERTVARLFRDQLGMSWQQWRQQAVLAHALPLLARGMAVSQVASASGYATDSAFCAMFKAATGQSPTAFQHKRKA